MYDPSKVSALVQAGDDALMFACRSGHLEMVQLLVLEGADQSCTNQRVSSEDGCITVIVALIFVIAYPFWGNMYPCCSSVDLLHCMLFSKALPVKCLVCYYALQD